VVFLEMESPPATTFPSGGIGSTAGVIVDEITAELTVDN